MKFFDITGLALFLCVAYGAQTICMNNTDEKMVEKAKEKTVIDDAKLVWGGPLETQRNRILVAYNLSGVSFLAVWANVLYRHAIKRKGPGLLHYIIGAATLTTYWITKEPRNDIWRKRLEKNI